jgi:hypothetical protein
MSRDPKLPKIILKKMNKAGVLTLPDFKPYYNDTVTQNLEYQHEDRHIDQSKKIAQKQIPLYMVK